MPLTPDAPSAGTSDASSGAPSPATSPWAVMAPSLVASPPEDAATSPHSRYLAAPSSRWSSAAEGHRLRASRRNSASRTLATSTSCTASHSRSARQPGSVIIDCGICTSNTSMPTYNAPSCFAVCRSRSCSIRRLPSVSPKAESSARIASSSSRRCGRLDWSARPLGPSELRRFTSDVAGESPRMTTRTSTESGQSGTGHTSVIVSESPPCGKYQSLSSSSNVARTFSPSSTSEPRDEPPISRSSLSSACASRCSDTSSAARSAATRTCCCASARSSRSLSTRRLGCSMKVGRSAA
eukprot:scaffold154539_cov24-Tisochrysis_lutea.AAC.5